MNKIKLSTITTEHPAQEGERCATVDTYLMKQQTLTAVERFSEIHDRDLSPKQGKYYQSLIPGTPPNPGQQYAFEVDLDRCSGCKSCITGCHNRNGLDEGETWRSVGLIHGEKKSEKILHTASLSDMGLSLENLETSARSKTQIGMLSGTVRYNPIIPIHFQQNISTACHHCAEPSCLSSCPVKAYEKDSITGIVKHLDDQCIGCKYCMYTCSYQVPQYNQKLGIVRKCDMCTDRLKEGEAPACVQSCPNEAIRITLVDLKEVQTDPGKYFQIPSSPSPHYSKPTTRYKTTKTIPEGAIAADHEILYPQPAEYPLVFMLVFTQFSAGAFCFLNFLHPVLRWDSSFRMLDSLVALSFGLLGLGLSLFHLGRPLYAFRVFLGFKTSWLSREAVLFGIYAQLAVVYTFLCWLPTLESWLPIEIPLPMHSSILRDFLGYGVAGTGLLGIFCSGMIYKDTPRLWWNSGYTLLKFFLTAVLLGSAGTIALNRLLSLDQETIKSFYGLPLLSVILLSAMVLKLLIEMQIFRQFRENPDHPLAKTAKLMKEQMKGMVNWRLITALLGVSIMLFLETVENSIYTTLISCAAFAMLLIGECLERHLFFIAVVPPKMPGNP